MLFRHVAPLLIGLLIVAGASLAACSPSGTEPAGEASPASGNPELAELYEADQADRSVRPIDWSVVSVRDSLRQTRVSEILAAGEANTSADFYHAAMVFQHGDDTTAARAAFDLARQAVELDSSNESAKWLSAAAWDRYLMRKGEPQWYGTQFVSDGPGEPWQLYDIDTTAVTDSARVSLGVRTLAESRARVREMNEDS